MSHVSTFPSRLCEGAELFGIQATLEAEGHSIFQCEEWVAQYSRCVPASAARVCSWGWLSSPEVCSRCSKAAREHLGAHQGESLSVLTVLSLGRAEDRQPSHSLLGESGGQRENDNGEKREREVGKMRRESDERAALQKMRLLSPSLGTLQKPHFKFKLKCEGNAFHLSKDD